jgi:hypothetical protein
VAWRHVVGGSRPGLDRRAVGQEQAHATRDDETEMPRLAPLSADVGSNVGRPPPTWLVSDSADDDVSEFNDLLADEVEFEYLIRLRQIFVDGPHT